MHSLGKSAGVLIALLIFSLPAWAVAPIGQVIVASGEVVALQADGVARPLQRKSDFYTGELLKTGANSRAQLRFIDGALMSLRPATEFRVDSHSFDATAKGNNNIAATLVKGGLRTITGLIVKENPSSYKLTTPLATIGVRGTDLEVVLGDTGLTVAFWGGAGTVTNDAGTLDLGEGADHNFAQVTSSDTPPIGQLTPPQALLDSVAPEEEAAAGEAPEDAASDETAPDPAGGDTSGAGPDTTDEGFDDFAFDFAIEFNDAMADKDGDGIIDVIDPSFNPNVTSNANPNVPSTELLSADELASLDRIGVGVVVFPGEIGHLGLTRASDGAGGSPLFAFDEGNITGFIPSGGEVLAVLRRDGEGSVIDTEVIGGNAVVWGSWAGAVLHLDSSTLALIEAEEPDSLIDTAPFPINHPVYWITAIPTANILTTGTGTYSTTTSFAGTGSDGAADDLIFEADVSFSGERSFTYISLKMLSGDDSWDVGRDPTWNFTGAFFDIPVTGFVTHLDHTHDAHAASGDITGTFTGLAAEGLAASFALEEDGFPEVNVGGVFVAEITPP